MARLVRISIIDDDLMLMQGFSSWVQNLDDLVVVQTATSVNRHMATQVDCDVVMLDLNLRDGTLPATNVARLVAAGHTVLMVSSIPDTEYVVTSIEAGAAGYITKDNDLSVLADALRDVARGRTLVTPELAFALQQDSRDHRPQLSARELEVLKRYAGGMTLDAVARRLSISPGTVREYLMRIKRKYHEAGRPARTKTELARRMREDRLELKGLAES